MRPTNSEIETRKSFRRYIVADKDISSDDILNENNITLKRIANGMGLPPSFMSFLLGRRASRNYKRGEAIEL